jgi:hypothetical protein
MGVAPILQVLLRLLVHDWYYVQVTEGAAHPYLYGRARCYRKKDARNAGNGARVEKI